MKQRKIGCVKAARIIGCTPMTIQRWRKGGSIYCSQRRRLLFVLTPKRHVHVAGESHSDNIEVKLGALLLKATASAKKSGIDIVGVDFNHDMMLIRTAIGKATLSDEAEAPETKKAYYEMIEQAIHDTVAFKLELRLDKVRRLSMSEEELKDEDNESIEGYIDRNRSDIIASIRFIKTAYIAYFGDIRGDLDDEDKLLALVLAASGFRRPNKLIEDYAKTHARYPPLDDPPCSRQVIGAVSYFVARRPQTQHTLKVPVHRAPMHAKESRNDGRRPTALSALSPRPSFLD